MDSLTLEDVSLHVFDQLFLFLPEELVLQLHSVDFLFHGHNFSLTNCWVKSVLHLFLKLILAFPEENLFLSLYHVDNDVRLLLLQLSDLILKLDGLVLHLL